MRSFALPVLLVTVFATFVVVTPPAQAATCGGARATVLGTDKDDNLVGTARRDVIVGLGGDDFLDGRGGDDIICGGDGRDTLSGGSGSDRLSGGRGEDQLDGQKGNDRLEGGNSRDALFPLSDPGIDVFDGGRGLDELNFLDADEAVTVDLSEGFVRMGDRREQLVGGTFEIVTGSEFADKLVGDDDDNVLFAGFASRGDEILGNGGNDYLEGYDGSKALNGGEGDDVISGIGRGDAIDGGGGTDLIRMCGSFSVSVNVCTGGSPGDEGVKADLGKGTITGYVEATFAGIEAFEGTASADELVGSGGADALFGGPREDILVGGEGDDLLWGDTPAPLPPSIANRLGPSQLGEAERNDDLNGGPGTDSLDGDGGTDTCTNGEDNKDCES
ncbi:MAG TPA: calcium-binding protein [Actinomycetota bacterium]|nr:calcium-binding protein [Actinomycetota bacterium]